MYKNFLQFTFCIAATLFAAIPANADIVGFTEPFDAGFAFTGAANEVFEFGNGNADGRGFGDFIAGSNGTTIVPGGINFGTGGNNNLRGIGTVLDIDGTAAGDLTVNFDFSALGFSVADTAAGFSGIGYARFSGVTTGAGGGATLDTHSGGVSRTDFNITDFVAATGTASLVDSGFTIVDTITSTESLTVNLPSAAGPGDALALIVIRSGGGDSAGAGGFTLDNISVAAVPEPSSLSLIGLSSLCMMAVRRRRK